MLNDTSEVRMQMVDCFSCRYDVARTRVYLLNSGTQPSIAFTYDIQLLTL